MKKNKKKICDVSNENGFVLVVGMMILVVLSIIGIAATRNTSIELQIAANEKNYKQSFYAAEAGRSHVEVSTELYGKDNITPPDDGEDGLYFPSQGDADDTVSLLDGTLSYRGDVKFRKKGSESDLRGLMPAFSVNSGWIPYVYELESEGRGPQNSRVVVRAGFFRIGVEN